MRPLHFKIIALLALALLVLSGCKQDNLLRCDDGRQVRDVNECSAGQGGVVIEKSGLELLLEKSDSAKTLVFMLTPPGTQSKNLYVVSRQRMRVVLDAEKQEGTGAKDEVYFDLENKKARYYCGQIEGCQDQSMIYDVDYEKYWALTPFDWLDEMSKGRLTGQSQLFDQKNTLQVLFDHDGAEGSMFVDEQSGIPVVVNLGALNYTYYGLVVNKADESALVRNE